MKCGDGNSDQNSNRILPIKCRSQLDVVCIKVAFQFTNYFGTIIFEEKCVFDEPNMFERVFFFFMNSTSIELNSNLSVDVAFDRLNWRAQLLMNIFDKYLLEFDKIRLFNSHLTNKSARKKRLWNQFIIASVLKTSFNWIVGISQTENKFKSETHFFFAIVEMQKTHRFHWIPGDGIAWWRNFIFINVNWNLWLFWPSRARTPNALDTFRKVARL